MAITFHSVTGADAATRELVLDWWEIARARNASWSRKQAECHFAWRYLSREGGETLIARDGEHGIAVIDSFLRPYVQDGRRIMVRETCDWFCRPDYRRFGIGVQLMRRMMGRPEPIIVIGGSESNDNLLPKLGWTRLPDVENFFLPLSARVTAEVGGMHRFVKLASGVVPRLPLFFLPRPNPPSASVEVRLRQASDDLPPEDEAHNFSPSLDSRTLDWLPLAPVFEVKVLNFVSDGKPVGVSICRLGNHPFGKTASILHLHTANPGLFAWMVGSTVRFLHEQGAGIIRCRSSSPSLNAALRRSHFLRSKPATAFWWSRDKELPHAPMYLSLLRADDGVCL